MKKIMMTKYGFVRWPEEDFSDDGNHFTCYRAGKSVRVSKLTSNGDVYLSASSQVGKGNLPYEIYSKLPHYHDSAWKYNGVAVESLTDEDLFEFYHACELYEKEYEELENSLVFPTLEEIRNKAMKVTAKTVVEINKVEQLLSKYAVEAATKFTSYEWKAVQDYLRNLISELNRYDPDTFPETIVGKSYSFDFVKPDTHMGENYYFKYIRDLFERYGLS